MLLLLSSVSTCSPLLVCLHLFVDAQTLVRVFCSKPLCLCFLESSAATRVYNLLCLCVYRSHSHALVSYVDTWHTPVASTCVYTCPHISHSHIIVSLFLICRVLSCLPYCLVQKSCLPPPDVSVIIAWPICGAVTVHHPCMTPEHKPCCSIPTGVLSSFVRSKQNHHIEQWILLQEHMFF